MHAACDTRDRDVIEKIIGAHVVTGRATGSAGEVERHGARAVVAPQSLSCCTACATVCSRVLGMRGRWQERLPGGISQGCIVAVRIRQVDGGRGTPEQVVILRLEAGANGVGVSCPQHGSQSGVFKDAVSGLQKNAKVACPKRRRGLGVKPRSLGLHRGAHRTRRAAERSRLVQVGRVLRRGERRRPLGSHRRSRRRAKG